MPFSREKPITKNILAWTYGKKPVNENIGGIIKITKSEWLVSQTDSGANVYTSVRYTVTINL